MKTVAFSFLGTQIDAGKGPDRWNRWRPNVALCQQDDLVIDRLELIHDRRHSTLADVISKDVRGVSPETEIVRHIIDFKNPWDFQEVYSGMRDFADGYKFRPDEESYLANLTTGTHVAQICWFLLTEARYIPGRLIQLSPAPKRSTSPKGDYQIIDLDLSKYDEIASRFAEEREEGTSFLKSGIVTRNEAFNTMIDQIEKVVIRSEAPVLLLGPTGAGKSRLAQRIFELKKSRHQIEGEFIEVNCATLRGDSAMSALFGHKRGAFTGAVADRKGLLRSADKGLLFLDEIGELGLDEQASILRAIEEKRFLPVGADREVTSDFQLIAGTNRDLREAVAEGEFREDLLARLDMWTYEMPGLKDRKEDLEPNIEFELAKYARTEGTKISFNQAAYQAYLSFAQSPAAAWTGNFRDLGGSIVRMATLADGGRISEDVVELEVQRLKSAWRTSIPEYASLIACLGEERASEIDPFDKPQLEHVLTVCARHASLSSAGRELFAVSRLAKSTSNDADRLKKYLAKWDLSWGDVSNA
ncbi:RNA repair transcriptional activator RtcR [Henriciella litoralis]|uniref:RNA repair transcriptional activator RtcR n=1 Tax=Henriciella litoralis TaxID=568102 RepID=UPI000A00BF9E|nr:RNA repair transcriptional activator RtcR [Henriciella litoralis]